MNIPHEYCWKSIEMLIFYNIGGTSMELVEIKCANCLKEIYVQKEFIRKEMFCTLRLAL